MCSEEQRAEPNLEIVNQLSTEIKLDGEVNETMNETKLLGTTVTYDLNWKKNTDRIVKTCSETGK